MHRGVRVPEEIAIIGIDKFESAVAVIPERTTLDQQNAVLAQHVIDLCERLQETPWPPVSMRRINIELRLVVRDSTPAVL